MLVNIQFDANKVDRKAVLQRVIDYEITPKLEALKLVKDRVAEECKYTKKHNGGKVILAIFLEDITVPSEGTTIYDPVVSLSDFWAMLKDNQHVDCVYLHTPYKGNKPRVLVLNETEEGPLTETMSIFNNTRKVY